MNPTRCQPERLSLLLQAELPPEETAAITSHLDTCVFCQHQLETLAGDASWWQEASRWLPPAGVFEGVPRGPIDPVEEARQAAEWDEAFLADFVVHYLEPTDNPALLGKLGTYEIAELIGRGGMGVVFKGFDRELNRYVAIKVLAPHLASFAAARKRFAREAQAAAAVVHPHVIAIHGVHGTGRLPYFVMPFVGGESLQQRLDREGSLELKEILRIAMQAARGLSAAHEQGLVHRDVKPANILLERGVDRVLLTDFGLARTADDATLTCSGVIAGTPQYMSPEQAKGDGIDHRADLFSLGSVIYAMCTGHPPFRAETALGILRRITDTPPRPIREITPELPGWLEGLIGKLLSKQADGRFTSAVELADLLGQCLAHVQQPTSVPLPAEVRALEKVRKRGRRRRWLASSLLTLVATAAAAWLVWISFPHQNAVVDRHADPFVTQPGLQRSGMASVDRSAVSPASRAESRKAVASSSQESLDRAFSANSPDPFADAAVGEAATGDVHDTKAAVTDESSGSTIPGTTHNAPFWHDEIQDELSNIQLQLKNFEQRLDERE